MKDKNMNEKINQAFRHATPDVLDSILSDRGNQEGKVIVMTEMLTKKKWIRYVAGIAAALVLIGGGLFGFFTYQQNFAVFSTVSLDVNPSIQITLNQKELVLDVTPLNEDGRIVVGDMDFSGNDIDVTVNALIGSMLRNGYLSELANSILISVDNNDPIKGAELQKKLTQVVNDMLQTDGFEGAVLSQTITNSSDLKKTAEQYGITEGKAQLIQEILKNDVTHTFEELASLNINELNLIAETKSVIPESVSTVGTASEKAYIGHDKAKETALNHAQVTADQITKYEIEMDTEQGVLVYEIEFDCNGYEYEYDIDAQTGEILKFNKEKDDDISSSAGVVTTPPSTNSTTTQPAPNATTNTATTTTASSDTTISVENAKEIALQHAGLSASSAVFNKVELDKDDGRWIYEVEFYYDSTEYDYEINAVTGQIISVEQEIKAIRTSSATGGSNTGSDSPAITQDQAKDIALQHAGLSASSIVNLKIELDRDDGAWVYEIEFDAGNMEYEYEIDGTSGRILDYDQEVDD